MKVNLFDSNFAHSPYSTAYQQSKYIQYVKQQMTFDGVTLFTDEWINNPIANEVQSRYKVGWLHEPYCLHPKTYERAIDNAVKFDFILTYDRDLIELRPDYFRFAPYAGTWIDKSQWSIKPKSKLCSMLIGDKMSTEGHRIRHDIARMIEENDLPVDFYGVKGQSVGYGQEAKHAVLNDYCFTVVTETCRENNLFTEWLLDCFALGTIPIFWGCPNIGQFFNVSSILQFDTVERLYKILRMIDHKFYLTCLSGIYDNLSRVENYAITEDWLYLNVLKELE